MKSVSLVKIALISFIATKCVFLISCGFQLSLLNRAPVTMSEARANDLRQSILGTLGLFLYLFALVTYFVWLYQAKKKTIASGARDVEYSPGLSVGCHFIPFANLAMPFNAMAELWKGSLNPKNWRNEPVSPIVGAWWGFWLASGVSGYGVLFFSKSGQGIEHLRRVTIALMLAGAITIAALSLLLAIVNSVSRRLENLGGPPLLEEKPNQPPEPTSGLAPSHGSS